MVFYQKDWFAVKVNTLVLPGPLRLQINQFPIFYTKQVGRFSVTRPRCEALSALAHSCHALSTVLCADHRALLVANMLNNLPLSFFMFLALLLPLPTLKSLSFLLLLLGSRAIVKYLILLSTLLQILELLQPLLWILLHSAMSCLIFLKGVLSNILSLMLYLVNSLLIHHGSCLLVSSLTTKTIYAYHLLSSANSTKEILSYCIFKILLMLGVIP